MFFISILSWVNWLFSSRDNPFIKGLVWLILVASEAILNEVIWDIATNADIIEKTYFGGDNN